MEILSYIWEVLARLPMWALFSTPLFLLIWGIYAYLTNRSVSKILKIFILAVLSTVLLTPMPMGMFLAFVPNGYLMFGSIEYYQEMLAWLLVSGSITLVASTMIFYLLISHNKALKRRDAEYGAP